MFCAQHDCFNPRFMYPGENQLPVSRKSPDVPIQWCQQPAPPNLKAPASGKEFMDLLDWRFKHAVNSMKTKQTNNNTRFRAHVLEKVELGLAMIAEEQQQQDDDVLDDLCDEPG